MPRDANGNVTLPVGFPVVDDTTIDASVHNNVISDLAAMIEDSLSRSGEGGMISPLQFLDGNVNAPGAAFASDTDTGLYRIGANNPAVTAGATKVQDWTATGTTITGTLNVTGAVTLTTPLGTSSIADGAITTPKLSASFAGNLSAPVTVTLSDAGSGAKAPGTWAYVVTAVNASGETSPSIEKSTGAVGWNGVKIDWSSVTGATSYKVYGYTSGSLGLLATVAAPTVTYTDTGGVAPGVAPPTANTAVQTIALATIDAANLKAVNWSVAPIHSPNPFTRNTNTYAVVETTAPIVTHGRPVVVSFFGAPDVTSGIELANGGASGDVATFKITRTKISSGGVANSDIMISPTLFAAAGASSGVSSIIFPDFTMGSSAGTYTYSISVKTNAVAGSQVVITSMTLIAYEL